MYGCAAIVRGNSWLLNCYGKRGVLPAGSRKNTSFCHFLQHLQENDNHILGLLSCESSEIFLRYFKDSLNELVQTQFINHNRKRNQDLPQEFLVNHISGSFVEMVLWWLKDKKKHTPEELDYYFRAVIEPIL